MRSNWVFVIGLIITANVVYSVLLPAYYTGTSYRSTTGDNWLDAMDWIKKNTPECTVIATWWDPGHLITALGERKVTNDGATQIGKVAQEIGTTLLTEDEDKAIDILRNYIGNCSDMYYIASSDLIGKSTAWSYLATWNPETRTGKPSNYVNVGIEDPRNNPPKQLQGQNAIAYKYPMGGGNAFIIVQNETTLTPYLLQMGNYYEIQNLVMFYNNTPLYNKNPDAPIPGTLWVSRPVDYGGMIVYPEVVYMPPELDNSMFTIMYFFDGYGLKHFKLVKSFTDPAGGDRIKIYEVDLGDLSTQNSDEKTGEKNVFGA